MNLFRFDFDLMIFFFFFPGSCHAVGELSPVSLPVQSVDCLLLGDLVRQEPRCLCACTRCSALSYCVDICCQCCIEG